jgi:serine/threonine-protein kinase
MAPEQARGDPLGPTADVWALGVVFYELLTGRLPFDGGCPRALLDAVQFAEPLPPHALRPELPRDLEAACLRCLRKRPEERFSAARGLANACADFLRPRSARAYLSSG